MLKRFLRCFTVLIAASVLLTGCGRTKQSEKNSDNSALTWNTYSYYSAHQPFLDLLKETYPDMNLEFISYSGANRTSYSWAQMRADDISDIFITSLVVDEDLAKERLVDLSGYEFLNGLSNAVLDQSAIDGGIYMLPTSYAMYGIFYNKTLMQEKGWELPEDFAGLEALCKEIQAEGLIPGIMATQLTGGPFSAFFNLAKTDWLSTPDGIKWEQDFLAGKATAAGRWESTMEYVQKYMEIGMFTVDPEDRDHDVLVRDYLGGRKAVFCTAVHAINRNTAGDAGSDEIGIMPYISEDGSKNVYMYSPACYIGISKRLTEPGNEEKLENAIKILSLLYSHEGQEAFLGSSSPTSLSVLDNASLSEDSMIYDARQALCEGRAFQMTYVHWDAVLTDMGQEFKNWLRGEEGAGEEQCIRRMDELMQTYLSNSAGLNFCTSTADFTLEQTAALVGKALGSAAGADASVIPLGGFHNGKELRAGITGKLYQGEISMEVNNTLCPAYDGEYAIMTMTGAQAKELVKEGFDNDGDGNPYPYLLVTRGNRELDDNTSYKVAFLMNGYTGQTAETYSAEVIKGSVRTFLHEYLAGQKTVSPDGNPWE